MVLWPIGFALQRPLAEDRPKPSVETIEVDDTFVGGKQRGHQHKVGHPECKETSRHRHSPAQRRTVIFYAEDVKSGTLAKYIRENISQDVDVIVTDDFKAIQRPARCGVHLRARDGQPHKKDTFAGDVYTNTVESAFSLAQARDCGNMA